MLNDTIDLKTFYAFNSNQNYLENISHIDSLDFTPIHLNTLSYDLLQAKLDPEPVKVLRRDSVTKFILRSMRRFYLKQFNNATRFNYRKSF